MYLINEKDEEGRLQIPFTDEPRLHPEDIKEGWIFIKSWVPLQESITARQSTVEAYLQALHSKTLTQLYSLWDGHSSAIAVGMLRKKSESLWNFCLQDLDGALGYLQAVAGEGIYLKQYTLEGTRGSSLANRLFSENIVDGVRSYTKFLCRDDGTGIIQICGWEVNLLPSHDDDERWEENGDICISENEVIEERDLSGRIDKLYRSNESIYRCTSKERI